MGLCIETLAFESYKIYPTKIESQLFYQLTFMQINAQNRLLRNKFTIIVSWGGFTTGPLCTKRSRTMSLRIPQKPACHTKLNCNYGIH